MTVPARVLACFPTLSWALCIVVSAGGARAASQSNVVYKHLDWEVRAVTWDDGATACVAEVTYPDEAFSVWADKGDSIRVQFYDSGWSFGDDSADVGVQIDSRASWKLHNANFYKQSILFDLPTNADGKQFLSEVVNGSTLYLSDAKGEGLKSYSLSGSQASIAALNDCVATLK
ncbi:MAG: hypothetical protein KGH84_03165 [Paracoccaceae bacterium]|nr:hypothetical protein [Paracoccaceae bacterium]